MVKSIDSILAAREAMYGVLNASIEGRRVRPADLARVNDVLKEATIRCPVCDELLSLDAAVEHDHLQVATTGVRRRS